ncbi:M24 family metallopeptidase [Candidatus Protochlamydia sp. R18]|uniref:M24 family metallopeptidase n=1 Tax=Candidatus Protochlamydia sp. R18 TaxID=1353977 RepID=UPI0005A63196|nr:M24 family metallopeptidase [Candidatus Protochlamydia sp. R18]
MEFGKKLIEVQQQLKKEEINGWLLYDFRHSNSLAYIFLEIPTSKMLSRRFFYWIPSSGEPIKIVPQIEPHTLDHLPGIKWIYKSWQELESQLFSLKLENHKVAMEYSPFSALPTLSKVDAGTIDFMRKNGVEIVSSANFIQRYTCVWNPQQLQSHLEAAEILSLIVDQTWNFIEKKLITSQAVDEYQVQQFMLKLMIEHNCVTADPPICAINANSADPHYSPKKGQALSIRPGDFILLDLWCKKNQSNSVYADITRVGVAAKNAQEKQKHIFNIVKESRDRATLFIKENYEAGLSIQGWQVDQLCRDVLNEKGYGEYFIHRTGHNIGQDVHGPGANLDNFETRDFRQLIPGTCFSIEPGIYLPHEFGVRLEYDVYLSFEKKIQITGGIQEELVCLNL